VKARAKSRLAACGVAAVLSCPSDVQAATIVYVDSAAEGANDGTSWRDAFADLQDALAVAQSGDEVWIAAGVYRPGPPEAGPEVTLNLVSGVAMYGGFAGGEQSIGERDWDANETILSGELEPGGTRVHHVLTGAYLAEGTVLDGLIVRDGYAGDFWGQAGGGLKLNDSVLLIANTTFTDNRATDGGAILSVGSDVALINSRFIDNRAWDNAGGIDAHGGDWIIDNCEFIGQRGTFTGAAMRAADVTLTVTDSLFHDNRNPSGIGYYGAVLLVDSSAVFSSSTFTANASYGHGAIAAFGELTLVDCLFTENIDRSVAGSGVLDIVRTSFHNNYGPALGWSGTSTIVESSFIWNGCDQPDCYYWGGAWLSGEKVEIRDTVFHGNGATLDVAGNLWLAAAEMTLVNCRITGGGSAHYGTGGMRVSGVGFLTAVNCLIAGNYYSAIRLYDAVQAEFINCTIANNVDWQTNGVGLHVGDGAHAVVRNSILWGNVDVTADAGDKMEPFQIAGSADVQHSIIQGLDEYDGPGNLGDDPLFADNDGRLSAGSPAIDAGSNDFVPPEIETDLDGNPRFVEGMGDGEKIVDMGAFEFQGAPIPGDLNGDGVVDVLDLLFLLDAWGPCPKAGACPADINGDGAVDAIDLLILLDNWS
jgi:predicted outer membrane repeat protein